MSSSNNNNNNNNNIIEVDEFEEEEEEDSTITWRDFEVHHVNVIQSKIDEEFAEATNK